MAKKLFTIIVKWANEEQFIVLSATPKTTMELIKQIELKLQAEKEDNYLSTDLEERLEQHGIKCLSLVKGDFQYDMLP